MKIGHVRYFYDFPLKDSDRINRAIPTWDVLYNHGVKDIRLTKSDIKSSLEYGDSRDIPTVNDLFDYGFSKGMDIVMVSNIDVALISDMAETVVNNVSRNLGGYSYRYEIPSESAIESNTESYIKSHFSLYYGLDLFFMKKSVWASIKPMLPDPLFLGNCQWDFILKELMFLHDANTELNVITHESHASPWYGEEKDSVSARFNNKEINLKYLYGLHIAKLLKEITCPYRSYMSMSWNKTPGCSVNECLSLIPDKFKYLLDLNASPSKDINIYCNPFTQDIPRILDDYNVNIITDYSNCDIDYSSLLNVIYLPDKTLYINDMIQVYENKHSVELNDVMINELTNNLEKSWNSLYNFSRLTPIKVVSSLEEICNIIH